MFEFQTIPAPSFRGHCSKIIQILSVLILPSTSLILSSFAKSIFLRETKNSTLVDKLVCSTIEENTFTCFLRKASCLILQQALESFNNLRFSPKRPKRSEITTQHTCSTFSQRIILGRISLQLESLSSNSTLSSSGFIALYSATIFFNASGTTTEINKLDEIF